MVQNIFFQNSVEYNTVEQGYEISKFMELLCPESDVHLHVTLKSCQIHETHVNNTMKST